MHVCFVLFPLFDLSFVDFPSVLLYCWLGLLTWKNCLPYNLYCVGGDVKHCTIQSNPTRDTTSLVLVNHSILWLRRPDVYSSRLPDNKQTKLNI